MARNVNGRLKALTQHVDPPGAGGVVLIYTEDGIPEPPPGARAVIYLPHNGRDSMDENEVKNEASTN